MTGRAGVELCDRVRPDLVVLDLMLPGPRRARGLPARPARPAGAGADADRARRGGGRAGRARRRRRRLHDQAVLAARAGRAHPGAAAARRAAAGADASAASWARSRSTRTRKVDASTARTIHLTPTEFDLLRTLAARPGAVLTPRAAAGRGLGLARRLRPAHGRLAHPRPAAQARPRPRPHRPRHRLRAGAMRPLDRLPSIKGKLGVVIVATVWGTVLVLAIGHKLGLSFCVALGARRRARPRASCSSWPAA